MDPVPPAVTGPPAVNVISPKKPGASKKFLLISVLAVLILGIIAAIYLVQSRQLISTGACDCSLYNFYVDSAGNVSVTNGQTISEPAQKATVSINGQPVAVIDVPTLSAGQTATLGHVTVPTDSGFSWSVIGTSFCSDSGSHIAPTPIPTQATCQERPLCLDAIPPCQIPEPEAGWCPEPTITVVPTVTIIPTSTVTPTATVIPTATATPTATTTPSPTSTVIPTPTATPSPTLTTVPTSTPRPADPTPAPPNRCNGSCTTDSNCTYGEDGTKLICVNNLCRHPSCTDQISCHCPSAWPASPTPTPAVQLAQSGSITSTLTASFAGLLLIGLGLLLAL